jgi:Flp pilus assembly protein TadD
MAFEQAIKFEDSLAARHIAYAKVQEKIGNRKLMIQELEKAAELEPNNETFNLLATTYEAEGMTEEADAIKKKLAKIALPANKPKRLLRPRRVVI